MSRPDWQEHLPSACGWCSLAAGNRGFCPGGIVKLAEHVTMPARWRVVRRVGWSTVTHPTGGVVLRARNHTSAIAYADRLARQEQR